jgi:hypothetical protein
MTSRFLCIHALIAYAVFSLAYLNGSEQKVKVLGGKLGNLGQSKEATPPL